MVAVLDLERSGSNKSGDLNTGYNWLLFVTLYYIKPSQAHSNSHISDNEKVDKFLKPN